MINSRVSHKKNMRAVKRLILSILLISVVLTLFLYDTKVYGSDKKSDKKEEYKVITVVEGDTLWSITSDNCNSYKDIRKAIHEIKKINNIPNSNIYPGQKIKIPVKLYK